MKIKETLDDIMKIFPEEWLSSYYLDEYSADIEIKDPSQNEKYLSVCIMNKHVGIAVLKEAERHIEFDLSGFDYSIEIVDKDAINKFFFEYRKSGTTPQE